MKRACARLLRPLVYQAAHSSHSVPPALALASGLPGLRLRYLADQPFRTLSSLPLRNNTDDNDKESKERLDNTNSLLQQVQVLKLRQELDDESQQRLYIPYPQLVRMVKASGAAHDDEEAEDVCKALHKAGVVLIGPSGVVYLRPEEIAEMVMQTLPGGREDAAVKLQKIEEELTDLDLRHTEADKHAHKTTQRFLAGGYIILVLQFVGFIYGTYWEFSWDVMEPIAYMISLTYTLIGYTYFLATKGGVFDLQPFKDEMHKRVKAKKVLEHKLDEERYQYLLRLKDRYRKQLAHSALRS